MPSIGSGLYALLVKWAIGWIIFAASFSSRSLWAIFVSSFLYDSCIEEISAKNLFDTNYFAPIFLAKGFADRRVSIKGIASITFIASISALLGDKSQTIYGGSKAALIASAKTISHELAPAVRVNCISPGPVNTPMTTRAIEQHGHYNTLDGLSLGVGEPDDVANLTVFLVSDKARWITGQNYILDGGYI